MYNMSVMLRRNGGKLSPICFSVCSNCFLVLASSTGTQL
jgi:hypothetical protein